MRQMCSLLFALLLICLSSEHARAEESWTMQLRAGVLSGTTWINSAAALTIGVKPYAVPPAYSVSTTYVQAAIYSIGPDPQRRAIKDYHQYTWTMHVWRLRMETGPGWDAGRPVTVGWWIPNSAEAFSRPCTPLIFRNGSLVARCMDSGLYGADSVSVIGSFYLAPGTVEDWTVMCGPIAPEPGTLLALSAGLAVTVGHCIRRRRFGGRQV